MSKVRLALSLATASLWYRRKVLALVCLTLTLSVTLLLGIQYLRTEVRQSFTSTISGTDLIVGARSGQLNLLLYSVFHNWRCHQQHPLVHLPETGTGQAYRLGGSDLTGRQLPGLPGSKH